MPSTIFRLAACRQWNNSNILSPHWPKSGGSKIVPPTFKTVPPPLNTERQCIAVSTQANKWHFDYLQNCLYRVGQKTRLFLRSDNFATTDDWKLRNMSKVSNFVEWDPAPLWRSPPIIAQRTKLFNYHEAQNTFKWGYQIKTIKICLWTFLQIFTFGRIFSQ